MSEFKKYLQSIKESKAFMVSKVLPHVKLLEQQLHAASSYLYDFKKSKDHEDLHLLIEHVFDAMTIAEHLDMLQKEHIEQYWYKQKTKEGEENEQAAESSAAAGNARHPDDQLPGHGQG